MDEEKSIDEFPKNEKNVLEIKQEEIDERWDSCLLNDMILFWLNAKDKKPTLTYDSHWTILLFYYWHLTFD